MSVNIAVKFELENQLQYVGDSELALALVSQALLE